MPTNSKHLRHICYNCRGRGFQVFTAAAEEVEAKTQKGAVGFGEAELVCELT